MIAPRTIQEHETQKNKDHAEVMRLSKAGDPTLHDQVQELAERLQAEYRRFIIIASAAGVVGIVVGLMLAHWMRSI